ncbi:hypothetical protein L195_g033716 [Trifolium pratense]|uniref:Uncharacterized protein n=1 Tax=Trifolium pratense TaxID=57577 RepID=A0A2K3LGT6_TRIPR|nr:hypothetical protein L195_g033716 [Trifolium pratense]
MLLVKEKDGSKRLCVDYRQLNKVVTEDKYSLAVLRCIKDDLRRSSVAEGLSSCACSRKLKINKRNYSTDELELAAVKLVLKVRRRYLYGSSYDFELNYHPGEANVVADALSRKTLHMLALVTREVRLIDEFRDHSLICIRKSRNVKLGMWGLTSAIILASEWNRLKPYMGEGVGHLCGGTNPVSE